MNNIFSSLILSTIISGMVLAQDKTILFDPEDSEDTRLEQTLAFASEQTAGTNIEPANTFLSPQVTHPLFIGVDDVAVPTYFGNPATNEWLTAFTGYQVWGAAYDNINDKIYFNSGSTLYEYPIGGTVTLLGTITDPGGATQSLVSLAFYNGTLFGTKNIANEAVYEINTTTYVATVVIDYVDADFDFGGLAVDPTNGEFYGTNDDTSPNGSGLFRINMDGSGTFITAYPSGQTDIDGLALSDSRVAYLIIDEPGSIFVYDLVGGAYLTPLTNPWTSSEIFSAGAWNSGIVPVELSSFTASISGSGVNLNWETATETNNSGFAVERKSAGSDFAQIGFVPGFGTTTEPKSYTFSDNNLQSGTYSYRLKQIDLDGTFEYSEEIEIEIALPSVFSLEQNYPNPFNPSTRIVYSIPEAGNVKLSVYNTVGEEVDVLINGFSQAGTFNITFNASALSAGVYLYKLQSGNSVQTRKMVLLR